GADANRPVPVRRPPVSEGAARPDVPSLRRCGDRADEPLLRRAGRRDAQPAADPEPLLLPGSTDSPSCLSRAGRPPPTDNRQVRTRSERRDPLGPTRRAATVAGDRPGLSQSLIA